MSNDYVLSLTPTDFEHFCYDILKGYAEEESLKNFTITHNEKIKADDGTYQIDIYAEFTALSSNIRILCECKQYTSPINREKVVILRDKLNSIGAHKGILLSTSEFQSGAIQYAKVHGIALIKVEDYQTVNYSHSNGSDVYDENDPFLYGEKHMPPVIAINCTTADDVPKRIYPSRSIIRNLYTEMNKLIKKEYGINITISGLDEE